MENEGLPITFAEAMGMAASNVAKMIAEKEDKLLLEIVDDALNPDLDKIVKNPEKVLTNM